VNNGGTSTTPSARNSPETTNLKLPIEGALPALRNALAATPNVVLEAPPGAGKTTRVPLALLNETWLGRQRIVMLEPRRLAARSAAHFMARQLGEHVGDTVGFRVRGETQVSARTRIEVVTEGILARLLAADPSLDGIGIVIFDEFHERSLHADIGLALTLQTQQVLRPELRVLVMSATLDGTAVSTLLANDAGQPAPLVQSAGRMFPVDTHYRPPRADERIDSAATRTILEAVQQYEGDVLVFLPGAAEQRRVAERLNGNAELARARVRVHQLHGMLSLADQDAAIALAPAGERKVVLATSLAETSLTIEGVRVVIDSGLSRLPRYSARAGFTRLETVRVSRASADQRRGRAGRVAPGVCFRLWDAHGDAALVPRTRPEILEADLAGLALALAEAGVRDATELRWLDAPPAGALKQAFELLTQLGAVNASLRITEHGRELAALPTHPRLAHLLLRARERDALQLGAELCALIEERDIMRGECGPPIADLLLRIDLLRGASPAAMQVSLASAQVDREAVRRLRQLANELRQRLVASTGSSGPPATRESLTAPVAIRGQPMAHEFDSDAAGVLLAMAYPDRVAQRRPGNEPRFLLRSGVGASLQRHDPLAESAFLAIADLDGAPPEYRIARAITLTREQVVEAFRDQIVRSQIVEWDEEARAVRAWQRTQLGAMVLQEHASASPDADLVRKAFARQIARAGVDSLPWSDSAAALRARMAFVHAHDPSWPDVGAQALTDGIELWLSNSIGSIRKWDDLARVDFGEALRGLLTWEQRARLDHLAPSHLDVPSGSRIALNYDDPTSPVLAVKLQEVFGWTSTPTLLNGRVPITLHLLSPAQRPVQVTRDLAGFWKTSYFEVRKDLRGRYPRHPWPEDPLSAPATRRAKPRGT